MDKLFSLRNVVEDDAMVDGESAVHDSIAKMESSMERFSKREKALVREARNLVADGKLTAAKYKCRMAVESKKLYDQTAHDVSLLHAAVTEIESSKQRRLSLVGGLIGATTALSSLKEKVKVEKVMDGYESIRKNVHTVDEDFVG